MEFYNEFHDEIFSKEDLEKLIIISAPIFPHLSEEVWEKTGHDYSVHMQSWPVIDEKHLKEEEVEIPVQINGKVRRRLKVNIDISEEEIRQKVLSEKAFSEYLAGGNIKRLIYVPGRIVNIVV
jgi:leucyl-tRNA synthetase